MPSHRPQCRDLAVAVGNENAASTQPAFRCRIFSEKHPYALAADVGSRNDLGNWRIAQRWRPCSGENQKRRRFFLAQVSRMARERLSKYLAHRTAHIEKGDHEVLFLLEIPRMYRAALRCTQRERWDELPNMQHNASSFVATLFRHNTRSIPCSIVGSP